MPKKLAWTRARDSLLTQLRCVDGETWDAVADALGISRNAAIARGHELGAKKPERVVEPEPEDLEREPLSSGSEITWGAITAATWLEGCRYQPPGA